MQAAPQVADALVSPEAAGPGFAVLGGVFDPVHNAHIALAECALRELPVKQVVFLPAGNPPHKRGTPSAPVVAPAVARLRMLELALAGRPCFSIDKREVERAGPSYTVLTLRELHALEPERRIFFIIGADNVGQLAHWYRAEEILDLCTPVVAARNESPAQFLPEHLPWLPRERIAELNRLALALPPIAISSSDIRRRAAQGLPLANLVPHAVEEYIRRERLYHTP